MHQTTVVSSFLPASICDGRYDADDEWRQLGVDAEEQEHRALVGERLFWASFLWSRGRAHSPGLEAQGTNPELGAEKWK